MSADQFDVTGRDRKAYIVYLSCGLLCIFDFKTNTYFLTPGCSLDVGHLCKTFHRWKTREPW